MISLGANLGNPHENMQSALRMLRESFGTANIQSSPIYETAPVGGPEGQQTFLNAVVALATQHDVYFVWQAIREIEQSLGRQRQIRWEARRIDIDILLADDQRIWTPHLKVPHPRMVMRSFILEPACQIASDWIEPTSGWRLGELRQHLQRAPRSVLVVGNESKRLREIEAGFGETYSVQADESIRFETLSLANHPISRSLDEVNRILRETPSTLLVAAIASPDPDSVAWEDFAKFWARAMNLAPSRDPKFDWSGPRYLLPAHDIPWAAHELKSIFQAMNCPVSRFAS